MLTTLHEYPLFAGNPVLGGIHHISGQVHPHAHDFVEIAVIGAGTGRHVTSQGERPVQQGDVIVLRPGTWHGFHDCADLTVANCCISARALRAEFATLHDVPMFRMLLWTEPVSRGSRGVVVTSVSSAVAIDATEAIEVLQQELVSGRRQPGRTLGRLSTVLGILADGHERQQPAEPSIHPAVTATIARLEAAPAEPWRLEDLAQAASLDPTYLGRLFRQHVGTTPLAFLARVRAERAASLLAHSPLPASRVGAAVGWPDPTYFARRFRALVGLTPTEYRQRSRPTERRSSEH